MCRSMLYNTFLLMRSIVFRNITLTSQYEKISVIYNMYINTPKDTTPIDFIPSLKP